MHAGSNTVGKLHVNCRHIEHGRRKDCTALRPYALRPLAHDCKNERDIVRRERPHDILFRAKPSRTLSTREDPAYKAELTVANELDKFESVGMIAQQMTHHENTRSLPGEPREVVALRNVEGQQLFYKDMLSSLERMAHLLAMERCRRGKSQRIAVGVIEEIAKRPRRHSIIRRYFQRRRPI